MFSSTPQTFRSPHLVAGPPSQHDALPDLSPVASAASQAQLEGLENAGRLVHHHLKEDASFVELSGKLRIATHCENTRRNGIKELAIIRAAMWLWCALFGVLSLQCKPTPVDLQT